MRDLSILSLSLFGSACSSLVEEPNPNSITEILNQSVENLSKGELENINLGLEIAYQY